MVIINTHPKTYMFIILELVIVLFNNTLIFHKVPPYSRSSQTSAGVSCRLTHIVFNHVSNWKHLIHVIIFIDMHLWKRER